MSLGQADTPAKLIYLAVQFIYTAKRPQDHHALYFRLAAEFLNAAPGAKPYIESINNRILTGEPYKALKEARKLIAYEKDHLQHAPRQPRPTRKPQWKRQARATLRRDCSCRPRRNCRRFTIRGATSRSGLDDALLFNRRLWTIFLDAVMSETNRLPVAVRENIRRLGVYIMAETFSLMTNPKPDHLKSIIKINRGIAAGLRGKA